jgi:NADH-quinone oxidoreductase subunit L
MVAMFLIFAELGSLDYSAMSAGAGKLAAGTATAIALLLFLGAVGKSAQIPLHVWLPDAMEGPTPVSALIHAATMVTAGVFLVARANPFFEASGGSALTVVSIIGAATALLAATVALIQVDIKRVLAYSTISQLGFMFLGLGVRAYAAAIFLVVAHAFYKATLFLGAGAVIHGDADNQDMRTMGGFRKYMPLTALGFIVAWLAIAGVPPFAGFWSKDEVLSRAYFAGDYGVWIVGVVAAALTAFYMTRTVWLVFFGNERFRAEEGAKVPEESPFDSPTVPAFVAPKPARLTHPPHESPPTMTFPILVLAAAAAVGGVLSLPFGGLEFLTDWLHHPTFEGVPEIDVTSFVAAAVLTLISVVVALVGLAVAYRAYRPGIPAPDADPLPARLGFAGRLFQHAYYFDETIANLVRGPVTRAAEWLSRVFDLGLIDGAVNGVATLVRDTGGRLRRVQTGLVRNYALGVVLGAVALIVFLAVRAG